MAQNQHINKVVFGSATLVDLTGTTATADKILTGYGAYGADGAWMDGTAEAGGGGSSYTLLATQEFEVSTESTNPITVGEIQAGVDAVTAAKMLYVRIRDKAGAREGHFIGSDSFFFNRYKANGLTAGAYSAASRASIYLAGSSYGVYSSSATTGYGVYPYSVETRNGEITLRARYNSNYSKTIDGTFSVEVYLLDWPDGISPFE